MLQMMLVPILLLTSLGAIDGHTASCKLQESSVLSHSSTGLAQVSNLGIIDVECTVPARPFPSKPGEFRGLLRVATTAFQIDSGDASKEVPSTVNVSGGGQNGSGEFAHFTLNLPLDPSERIQEFQRWFDKLQEKAHEQFPDKLSQQELETLSNDISQHRAGHFRVECRVLDGTRVVGVDVLEFEVLFKGRFSDEQGFPGYWPAPPPK